MKLIVNNISKFYGTNKALSDFTACFCPGIYALLGPNGSGKSTLINIITDNLEEDEGELLFETNGIQKDIHNMGESFREQLGFMPQYPELYPNFTVEEYMWYVATLKDICESAKGRTKKQHISEQITSILEAVDLCDVSNKKIKTLSGGMKQRLALAQAVLGDPSVIILDEPTAGLDPKQRISIRNYISKIALNKIVIIATHVVADIEFIANEIIMLKKGVVIDSGPPQLLTSIIDGHVWNVHVDESSISTWQQSLCVTNISRDDSNKNVILRVISEKSPADNAVAVCPTLEDYYLYLFGESGDNNEP